MAASNKKRMMRVIRNRSPENVYTCIIQGIKGGTGKTSVAINIAFRLKSKGLRVGLIDMDVDSANVPAMLDLRGREMGLSNKRNFEPVKAQGLKIFSTSLIFKEDDLAFTMNGAASQGIVQSALRNTLWEDVDVFVIDLPAGSSDILKTVIKYSVNIMGNIIVTLPNMAADMRRAVEVSARSRLPVTGVIENMKGLVCRCGCTLSCPKCESIISIYNDEGIEELCEKLGVHYAGSIPISLSLQDKIKKGRPLFTLKEAPCIGELADVIHERIVNMKEAGE